MLSRLERLLAELKRRHVLRMAGFYAVAAWVIVQVAATTFPFLGLPSWAVSHGFPPTVIRSLSRGCRLSSAVN